MNNKLPNAMGAAKPGEMVDPPLLTLQFDGIRIPKLEETAFRLSSRTSLIETARVDGKVKWTNAVKALCLFLLEYRIWTGSPETFSWQGERPSAVTSLDEAFVKDTTIWPAQIFGEGSKFSGFLIRANTGQKDTERPMVLRVMPNRFPQTSITLYWRHKQQARGNKEPLDKTGLKNLLEKIKERIPPTWNPAMVIQVKPANEVAIPPTEVGAFPSEIGRNLSLQNTVVWDDQEILRCMARGLDRPAFTTPFREESNLADFKKAIGDTIQMFNTGIWQTREGKEISRFPTRHDVKDPKLRSALAEITDKLVVLRAHFDRLITNPWMHHRSDPGYESYFFDGSHREIDEMDELRSKILRQFHEIYPPFSGRVGWKN